jgi:hypothetical protein
MGRSGASQHAESCEQRRLVSEKKRIAKLFCRIHLWKIFLPPVPLSG